MTVIIFMKETLISFNSCDGAFPTLSSLKSSLNDGIMFINGSVLNASSRVVSFASNVEND